VSDEDSEFDRLISSIDSLGFAPTLENIWDLIPYSFVVDWFIDIGGLLERVDTRLRLLRLNIRYTTMSKKDIVRYNIRPSVELPLSGTVEKVHYHRWVSDQCPVPALSAQPTFQGFNHWLESGALILSRSKH